MPEPGMPTRKTDGRTAGGGPFAKAVFLGTCLTLVVVVRRDNSIDRASRGIRNSNSRRDEIFHLLPLILSDSCDARHRQSTQERFGPEVEGGD